VQIANKIGYPVMVRPSYVLGGRAMMTVYGEDDLRIFAAEAFAASPEFPVLIDKFLEDAVEADVDCVCDGVAVYIGGIMEHVEEAGVHSGDSACVTPPYTLSDDIVAKIEEAVTRIALELGVKGLMNVQVAVKDNELYIIEINPRASRTVPFLSKATGVPLAKIAARICVGQSLAEIGLTGRRPNVSHYAVKEAVFPFNRFAGVDPVLGPEMKSTGEVMGIDTDFHKAYWKSQIAAGQNLPVEGLVFLSAKDSDKGWMTQLAVKLSDCGFNIAATSGTAAALKEKGIEAKVLAKLADEDGETVLDLMHAGKLNLIVNTPSGIVARKDEIKIRSQAILHNVPIVTTKAGAIATVDAIKEQQKEDWTVRALQDFVDYSSALPSA
jgi:carbamoyl-phosphate synthase large subunit